MVNYIGGGGDAALAEEATDDSEDDEDDDGMIAGDIQLQCSNNKSIVYFC